MKITKKLEAELKLVMKDYWQAYLKGDLDHWVSFLVDDYQNIGTTEAEIWKSKKEIYNYTSSVLDQMVGLTELRNKKTEIIPYDPYVMVHEFLDIYIKAEEKWIFYSKLRLSSLIQKIDNTWKILHQHGSYPDSKVMDGEFFAFDTLKSENLKLQKAIKKRTLELEKTNRELEIEAALEKVRSSALIMKNPADMVYVCNVISDQLELLGVKDIRNVQTAIINEQKASYLNYQYFAAYKKGVIEDTDYIKHPTVSKMVEEMKKSANSTFSGIMTGKELITFREWRKQYHQFPDPILDEVDSGYYYFYSIGIGGLGLTTYKPLSEEGLDVFKRFHNVFTLAYRRFIDIEKAIAQAREAKIEASLERVRTVAMSMMKSDELLKVCESVFNELRLMGFDETDLRNAQIVINNDEKEIYNGYQYSDYTGGEIAEVPYDMHPIIRMLNNKLKQSTDAFADIEISGEAMDDWKTFVKSFPQKPDEKLNAASELHYYFYSVGIGALGISSFKSLTEEKLQILQRLRNVFNLSYQRYIDIALAEAQAREAKVEAALERIRSLALGMRKSEEVGNVTDRLFTELKNLSVDVNGASIVVIDEDIDKMELWRARSNIAVKPFESTSFTESMNLLKKYMPDWFPTFFEALVKRKNYLIDELSGDKRLQFINVIAEQYKYSDEEKSQLLKNTPEKITTYYIFFKLGYLALLGEKQLSQENLSIARRFVEVFEFSYTRFLDIKNAEARTREAQIEAALEKVRSRSLAMNTPNELGEVVTVIVEKLKDLGVVLDANGVVLCTYFKDSKDVLHWIVSPDFSFTGSYLLPYFNHSIFSDAWESKESGAEYFSKAYSKEEKDSFFEYAFEHSDYKYFPEDFKQWVFQNDKHILSFAWQKKSAILIPSHTGVVPSENEIEILKRFSRVFEQAYVRFIDIQKVEAQAREAKIEVALEKVRSRTMGMQKGEELQEVAVLLYKELIALGVTNFVTCGYVEIHEKTNKQFTWVTAPGGDTLGLFYLPLTGDATFDERYAAWKRQQLIFHQTVEGEERSKHLEYAITTFQSKEAEEMVRNQFPDPTVFYCFNFSHGYLHLVTGSQLNHEEEILVARFTKVFEQTYTRFLDLQKAEAQAREAQIELSLERIRAQVTAMRESSELLDIVVTMRSEFVSLGHEAHYFWHMRWLPDKYEKAMTSGDGTRIGMVMSLPRHIHGDIAPVADWEKSDKPIYILAMDVETAVEYVDKMITLGDFEIVDPQAPSLDDIRHIGGLTFVMARTTHGEIGFSLPGTVPDPPKDALDTLVRFAGVFDLAYKRFEDLKSAEHRHREAQIELALERVRSRSMAMHQSDELADLSLELVKQVHSLGVDTWFCAFNIYDDDLKGSLEWGSNGQGTFTQYRTPREGIFLEYYEAGQRGENFLIKEIGETECPAHYEYLCSLPGVGDQLLKMKSAGIPFPKSQIDNVAYFKYGYIIFITFEPVPEAHDIFKRFARVFEQTYTRFLDIQRAEEQARKSKIEAALERVRSRTMAMHKSSELSQTAAHLFSQLNELGIKPYRCNIAIVDNESNTCQLWSTTNSGNVIPTITSIPLDEHPIFIELKEGWKLKRNNHIIKLQGELRLLWTKYISRYVQFKEYKSEYIDEEKILKESSVFSNFYFNQGFFVIHTKQELTETDFNTIQRFTSVFEQTYTRFQDLENVERQNKIIQAENERKTQELEEARELQLAMLPKELPKLPNIEIAVYMQTATEVGGDYYDFHVDDNGIFTGVIGDATGHGMKAGTIVTITKSLFNTLAVENNILEIFYKISKVIKDMKFKHLSMCLMMIKIEENILSMSSAAMPPALIYRKNKDKVEEFELRGMPLGAINNFPYKSVETKLHPGDTILLMSDGLPELLNEQKFMYGYDRIKTEFCSIGKDNPDKIIERLKDSASNWVNGNDPDDDITFVVIKVK